MAIHHDLRLLKRCQARGQLADDLLPLLGHLPGARLEHQVTVDGILDGVLQPADVHLVGRQLPPQGSNFRGTLRRLGRRRLLQLLILPLQRGVLALQLGVLTLQLGVFAFGDAAREEDSGSAEQEQDTTWQTPWYQSVISPLGGTEDATLMQAPHVGTRRALAVVGHHSMRAPRCRGQRASNLASALPTASGRGPGISVLAAKHGRTSRRQAQRHTRSRRDAMPLRSSTATARPLWEGHRHPMAGARFTSTDTCSDARPGPIPTGTMPGSRPP
jgi:hypothetical protein